MPTKNPRINVVLEKPLCQEVQYLAKRECIYRHKLEISKKGIRNIRRPLFV